MGSAGKRLRRCGFGGRALRGLEDLPDALDVAFELVVAEVLHVVGLRLREGAPGRGGLVLRRPHRGRPLRGWRLCLLGRGRG